MRPSRIALVSASMLAGAANAYAQGQSWWSHNGSVVVLTSEGNARIFRYEHPRSGLSVRQGDVVFHGVRSGSTYSGTAYLYSSRCPTMVGYPVTGTVATNQRRVVLRGRAPRRDARCRIVGYVPDTLIFEFIPNPELW